MEYGFLTSVLGLILEATGLIPRPAPKMGGGAGTVSWRENLRELGVSSWKRGDTGETENLSSNIARQNVLNLVF